MGTISRDQLGTVHGFDETPHRIVSLVPSQTELLFALGLDEEIIGITDYCIHPAENCGRKTKVGGPKSVDFAVIATLKPDLIIANKEENSREEIESLSGTYPVWISDIYTLDDALDMIRGIGALVNRASEAGDIVSRILTGLEGPAPPVDGGGLLYLERSLHGRRIEYLYRRDALTVRPYQRVRITCAVPGSHSLTNHRRAARDRLSVLGTL